VGGGGQWDIRGRRGVRKRAARRAGTKWAPGNVGLSTIGVISEPKIQGVSAFPPVHVRPRRPSWKKKKRAKKNHKDRRGGLTASRVLSS